MPKKNKTVPNPEPESTTFEIKIKGAVPGSSYSLYIGDSPRRYTQGVVEGSILSIKFPKDLGKSGTFGIKAPRTDRLFNPPQINIPFKVEGDSANLTITQPLFSSPPPSPSIGKKAKAKTLIENKLKEQVETAEEEIHKEEVPASPAPARGPGGRFVSKKLIGNKLREEVKKAQEEGTPLDGGSSTNNNESGGSEDKSKDSFWDKFR